VVATRGDGDTLEHAALSLDFFHAFRALANVRRKSVDSAAQRQVGSTPAQMLACYHHIPIVDGRKAAEVEVRDVDARSLKGARGCPAVCAPSNPR